MTKRNNKKTNDIFEKEALIRLNKRRRKNLKRYTKKRILIPVFAVMLFVIYGIYSFINSLSYQSTDDAFVEGRFVQVAPKVSGQVISLNVDDNTYVKEGDLLLEIDPRDFENKVNELQSALKEAQATKEVYAQLPAQKDIEVLENGQFVKYDYANGVVNFEGDGEWMLVFNEIKVYREGESDCDFAMIKDNYVARVYSPIDGDPAAMEQQTQPRYYGGKDAEGNDIPKVTTPADPWEMDSTDNPFAAIFDYGGPKMMPENTKMVPRVLKTNVGDIFTTNTIMATTAPSLGDTFKVGDDGYLTSGSGAGGIDPTFQVVKVYDLGDRQRAVKFMRIN